MQRCAIPNIVILKGLQIVITISLWLKSNMNKKKDHSSLKISIFLKLSKLGDSKNIKIFEFIG